MTSYYWQLPVSKNLKVINLNVQIRTSHNLSPMICCEIVVNVALLLTLTKQFPLLEQLIKFIN